MDIYASILLCGLAVLSLLLLLAEGLLRKPRALFIATACIVLAFALRAACMPHITSDYEHFLSQWVRLFRENGGFAAVKDYWGNYNYIYIYFLALFSYSSIPDLYLIKLLSIFFDIMLAWGVLRLARHFRLSIPRRLVAFLGTLLLPTVILNGAYWGQCDSIYVSLAVWSLYFALRKRGIPSMVFMALSLAFKMQAVFFMPMYFIFLFTRRIKWWHLPVFPITYILTLLPAVALGKPFLKALKLYFSQTGSIGTGLNYNSPSVFALIKTQNTELFTALGIAAAFLFILLIYFWLWRKRSSISDTALIVTALLLVLAIPFLLPRMHDRYFFGADVMSFAAAVLLIRLAPVTALCSFASLLGYHAYLKMRFLLLMSWGAAALIVALLWLLIELADQLNQAALKPRRRASG